MSIEFHAVKGAVVVRMRNTCEHFEAFNIHEAHELMTQLAEVIGNAQGQDDALTGKVKTPTDCPLCKARNVTPRHVCKRVIPRERG